MILNLHSPGPKPFKSPTANSHWKRNAGDPMLTSRCRRNPPDKLGDQGIGSAGTRNNPRSRMFKTPMSPTYSCALIISRSPACLVSVAISSTISIPLALCFWAKNYGTTYFRHFSTWSDDVSMCRASMHRHPIAPGPRNRIREDSATSAWVSNQKRTENGHCMRQGNG